MSKPIQISIPSPCHEDWQRMTPAEKGRFCDSCQKKVHDFTASPDREIVAAIAKDSRLCGRFRGDQLNRDLFMPKEKSTVWMVASATVLGFLGIGTHQVTAQVPISTEQHETEEMLGKVAPAITKMAVTGTISDKAGPLPGATVINKASGESVAADIEGIYHIEATPGDILEFSYAGYDTKGFTVGTSNTLNIYLSSVALGVVHLDVYGYIKTEEPLKKRTFFGRIFHSIGNLFR